MYIFIYVTFLYTRVSVVITSCVPLTQAFANVKKNHCFIFITIIISSSSWQSVNVSRERSILNFYLRPYLEACGPFIPDKTIQTR